jgi:hypothetical protein
MDLSGDLVDFKSVRAAYAYAWGVNATTGDVGQVTFAANGFDGPNTDPVPRLNVVSADPTELTLTVEAASVFSATHNVDKYMIFAMKDISQTSADVLTFVNAHLESFIEFTGAGTGGSHKTPFGEHNDFDPDLLEDDLYNVPAYSVVITQAFTQTANAEANELVVSGTSYRVYMAAKDTNGTTNLYEYPTLLDMDAALDTSIARVGEVKRIVTLDDSVQNYHTVSFGLDSVTASSVENAEVYAAIFTRDLKNEKHTGSLGDFKNEVYSVESRLTPVLFVPAGTTVTTLSGFTVNKAFDTNGDLVDLYTVNTGYLYVWASTLGTTTSGGRSVIREKNNIFASPFNDAIGSGWTEIKYLSGGSTAWFPGNDNLLGYGGTEFLFTTGDLSRWLVCDQFQVNGENYSNSPRNITRSSISAIPYQARWHYRPTVHLQDPWVSLEDHDTSYTNGTIMYGENSYGGSYELIIHPTGMYVFVR